MFLSGARAEAIGRVAYLTADRLHVPGTDCCIQVPGAHSFDWIDAERFVVAHGGSLSVVGRDGASPQLLCDGFSWVRFPRRSPDGQRIVFVGYKDGDTPRIWLVDVKGGSPVHLCPGQEPEWFSNERILFEQYSHGPRFYAYDFNSKAVVPLAMPPSIDAAQVFHIACFDEGSRLAFSTLQGIHVIDRTSGSIAQVTWHGNLDDSAVFTADGEAIIFRRRRQDPELGRVDPETYKYEFATGFTSKLHESPVIQAMPAPWIDEAPVDTSVNLVAGIASRAGDATVNMVVEIPAGSNAKWEVDKADGALRWEQVDGRPRVVAYLPYPVSYGMIPRTLLPEEEGGDGDPLDIMLLGPPAARGAVLPVRLIGVMEMLDSNERDDKLLAVRDGNCFSDIHSVAELRLRFPGVTEILAAWFEGYKGPHKVRVRHWGDAVRARQILEAAEAAYRDAHP